MVVGINVDIEVNRHTVTLVMKPAAGCHYFLQPSQLHSITACWFQFILPVEQRLT